MNDAEERDVSVSSELPPSASRASDVGAKQDFYLAEFPALRDEIMRRTEMQHRVIAGALAATGAFLALKSPVAGLGYPVLALFLAVAWVHSDYQIARLGTYIRLNIEPTFMGAQGGWEAFLEAPSSPQSFLNIKSLEHYAARGVFVGTQLLMVVCCWPERAMTERHIFLIVVDVLCLALTCLVLSPYLHDLPQLQRKTAVSS